MVKDYYLISDTAKMVEVESHVLRYWEEELKLPIKRNELGHRYYTQKDVERFREIKELKEQGLQLKAIRMILKDGKLSVEIPDSKSQSRSEMEINEAQRDKQGQEKPLEEKSMEMQTREEKKVPARNSIPGEETKAEKARRLQWLLQQMIAETLRENNQELCQDIRESVVKELDYQFRLQEEKEEEKEKDRNRRQDEYYQKLDELLRQRSKRGFSFGDKEEKKNKRKRHSFF